MRWLTVSIADLLAISRRLSSRNSDRYSGQAPPENEESQSRQTPRKCEGTQS
ncbi:hypothetical protein RBSH_04929 [Rhodopirellula baltica SH28]|uniref:Uncharacterized protein n=3 Tax=Rhodopirellula baltica TaxID=265606 RepID=F2AWL4_RHOBT|nr:hypothetical protein RBWH47_00753 [Rhodopirellula baltica WH47]EKJ99845.1 hypothetical protein RBSH_04929 [Rhodopirellula baltica SH28]ELP33942.1 hypothetical protein RBSWK_02078 [Rhodopirellula baltica SWK14]